MASRRICRFCQEKRDPQYKEVDTLRGFVSERGRILARGKTGVCARHQNRLMTAIKRARHLALLPFVAGIE
jgi:small subunit ribosomal protein S18